MHRTGLVENNATNEQIIYKARELYPLYPGIIDLPCWEMGRTYCDMHNPKSEKCTIADVCAKHIT
jgi:endonuclease III